MEYDIIHRPSYALGRIRLRSGEHLVAEAGAMVSMSNSVKMETSTRGGVFGGLKRAVLGGESFFMNTFTAERDGEVTIAPALPGDIQALELHGQTLFVQSGSFLASTEGINVDTKWGGARGFFSSEGLILLKCSGTGLLFLSSYGAIEQIDLASGQEHVVDTGHMVAFDESVDYSVSGSGGWKQTLFSGEGLVMRVKGPGRFYMQTRSEQSLLSWLVGNMPKNG